MPLFEIQAQRLIFINKLSATFKNSSKICNQAKFFFTPHILFKFFFNPPLVSQVPRSPEPTNSLKMAREIVKKKNNFKEKKTIERDPLKREGFFRTFLIFT